MAAMSPTRVIPALVPVPFFLRKQDLVSLCLFSEISVALHRNLCRGHAQALTDKVEKESANKKAAVKSLKMTSQRKACRLLSEGQRSEEGKHHLFGSNGIV